MKQKMQSWKLFHVNVWTRGTVVTTRQKSSIMDTSLTTSPSLILLPWVSYPPKSIPFGAKSEQNKDILTTAYFAGVPGTSQTLFSSVADTAA